MQVQHKLFMTNADAELQLLSTEERPSAAKNYTRLLSTLVLSPIADVGLLAKSSRPF